MSVQEGDNSHQGTRPSYHDRLAELSTAKVRVAQQPYCIPLHIDVAQKYLMLGYPDLAAGEAYKALLLTDAIRDENDEYHEAASAAIHDIIVGKSSEERCQDFGDDQSRSCDEPVGAEPEALVIGHYIPLMLVFSSSELSYVQACQRRLTRGQIPTSDS